MKANQDHAVTSIHSSSCTKQMKSYRRRNFAISEAVSEHSVFDSCWSKEKGVALCLMNGKLSVLCGEPQHLGKKRRNRMWCDKSRKHLVCWTRWFAVRQNAYGLGLIDFPHCTLDFWLHYTYIYCILKDFKCALWKRWSCKYDTYMVTIRWESKQHYIIQNTSGASQQNA